MAYRSIPPQLVTESTTLGGAAATIDVTVTGGDGLYLLEFEGTTAAGAAPNINLRMNGGALTSPTGLGLLIVGGGAISSFAATDGRVYSGSGMGGGAIATISFYTRLSIRNGAICSYASQGEGNDGTTRVASMIQARHSPAAAVTSVGLAVLTVTFGAGSILMATKIAD